MLMVSMTTTVLFLMCLITVAIFNICYCHRDYRSYSTFINSFFIIVTCLVLLTQTWNYKSNNDVEAICDKGCVAYELVQVTAAAANCSEIDVAYTFTHCAAVGMDLEESILLINPDFSEEEVLEIIELSDKMQENK